MSEYVNSCFDSEAWRFARALMDDFPLAEQMLRHNPALIASRAYCGETPLHYLCIENRTPEAQWLIENGADVNAHDEHGYPILNSAVSVDALECFKLLLRRGATVDSRDSSARTPLLEAASRKGRIKFVRILLEAGADPNANDSLDTCPLHEAVESGDIEIVRALVDAGADILKPQCFDLLPVQSFGDSATSELLDFLFERGSPLQARDCHGNSLLHSAAYLNSPELVAYFVAKGLDPQMPNDEGATPADEATRGFANKRRSPFPPECESASDVQCGDDLAPSAEVIEENARKAKSLMERHEKVMSILGFGPDSKNE